MMEAYWKVIKYRIDREYNERYPVHALVQIEGEQGDHLWFLPEEVLSSENYDWSEAIETDVLIS